MVMDLDSDAVEATETLEAGATTVDLADVASPHLPNLVTPQTTSAITVHPTPTIQETTTDAVLTVMDITTEATDSETINTAAKVANLITVVVVTVNIGVMIEIVIKLSNISKYRFNLTISSSIYKKYKNAKFMDATTLNS